MKKVVFCGYRSWAKRIIESVFSHEKIICKDIIYSYEDYNDKVKGWGDDIDIILFLGWSWIIPKEITNRYLCLGIHPSDLPLYRGGSPIQHQIINGVKDSKVTLMTLSSEKLDGGDIWMKGDLSLRGDNMDLVFNNIVESSVTLINDFFDKYPNVIPYRSKLEEGSYYKRRKPSESRILLSEVSSMKLVDLYNFIRALTDPYPNAYLEDERGNRLILESVKYEKNN